MDKEAKIIISIAGIAILGVVLLMILNPKVSVESSSIDTSYLVASTSHMTGSKTALVTLVEFGDYECPACANINPSVEKLVAEYKTNPDFNFVFRNFPLPQHNNAMIAAEVAEAAASQGKFWEMKDLLYEKQNEWAESATPIDLFVKYAKELKLDTTKFKSDVENKKYEDIILSDRSDGNKVNVSWTPTFYLNGKLQDAAGDLDAIKSKIDLLLKK